MILVSLGTHERAFYRLLKEIEKLIVDGAIKEKVIVQTGYTQYKVKGANSYDFIEFNKMRRYIKNCSVLITHGGVGSITDGLEVSKPIIVVPRMKKYDEHSDDHQLQIVKAFKNYKNIIPVYNIKKLKLAIAKARKLRVEKREHTSPKILKMVENSLMKWEKDSFA